MSAVIKRDVLDVPAPQTNEGAALIGMIERAARDPAVDIEKMERLFLMHERMTAARAKADYLNAFSALQAELPAAARKGKGHNDKAYARFEDVTAAYKDKLSAHGFSLSFRIDNADKVRVTGVLGHRGGHSEETSITLPADASGSKNAVQAFGSSVSYGKRYVALTLLGIATQDDDDAKTAAGVVTDEQAAELMKLIGEAKADISKVLEWHKIESLSDMPARDFEKARAMLFARKAKLQKDART